MSNGKNPTFHPHFFNWQGNDFPCYDLCFGCATHSLLGQMPLEVTIRDSDGELVDLIKQYVDQILLLKDGRVSRSMLGNALCVARLTFLMKTIVVGLGNPILGDDGVGWKVAEEVKKQFPPNRPVAIEFLSLGGISLMEHLVGYERAILIDAVTSDQETGSVIVSKLREMPDHSAFHTTSAHDTSLQNALKLGKAMGVDLPEDVIVVGVATDRIYDFSEEVSPAVAEAIPKATKIVMCMLA